MNDAYECIVVGGGPAGSTVAALVAQAGFSTLLVEREKMPRYHVGESLLPETYWTLQRLGVLDRMRASNFVRQLSVQFVSHTGRETQPFFFKEHDPRESSETWQVKRSEFDQMLWANARDKGADAYEATTVSAIMFSSEQATGAKLQTADGAQREVAAKVVVDATGQETLLARQLGLRVADPHLQKAAIWGYYRGARREQGSNAGATIILRTKNKQAWFWYVPLQDDLTSIGVVGDESYLLARRGEPETIFEEELVNCPAVLARLVNAELASRFRTARNFSYSTSRHAGDGWVLVGDAGGFVDPIYSTGVMLALKSGEMAADAIIDGLGRGEELSAEQLGRWTGEFEAGVGRIRKLVLAFYSHPFSFGQFIKEHPEHQPRLSSLLLGRVFQAEGDEVLRDIEQWLIRAQ